MKKYSLKPILKDWILNSNLRGAQLADVTVIYCDVDISSSLEH